MTTAAARQVDLRFLKALDALSVAMEELTYVISTAPEDLHDTFAIHLLTLMKHGFLQLCQTRGLVREVREITREALANDQEMRAFYAYPTFELRRIAALQMTARDETKQ